MEGSHRNDGAGCGGRRLYTAEFKRQPPDFYALVAEVPSVLPGLAGMLVYYLIPFSFRARPTLYIKELYVADAARRLGVGEALMRAAAAAALEHDCATIEWQVA